MKFIISFSVCLMTAGSLLGGGLSQVSGQYLEVRSCDVYTGPCFANAEMGLAGKEGIMVWSVGRGDWQGTPLDGLNVIAVVRTQETLGDLRYQPRSGKAVLILDKNANAEQRKALHEFARYMSGDLIEEVVGVETTAMEVSQGSCSKKGCATVKAEGLVEISTRCLGSEDHLCGNEEVYYPPLTEVDGAYPVYTEVASYHGEGLDATWELTGQRSGFLGSFAR